MTYGIKLLFLHFLLFFFQMNFYKRICDAYDMPIDYSAILKHDALNKLIQCIADSTSCYPNMFLLPLLTTVSGLMGVSFVRTNRSGTNLEEPNIIWSCVAAEPGTINVNMILFLYEFTIALVDNTLIKTCIIA